MNPEELKIIEDERQKILNDILEELQTKSLKELFFETSDKENRIDKVKNILEEEYELLDFNEYMLKKSEGKECWVTFISETLERIEEIKNDYSNYIQGGYGYISDYLIVLNEIESEYEID